MAKNLTAYQQQIVRRWYANFEAGRAQRLADLVSEIWLATTEKRRATLWEKAGKILLDERTATGPGGTSGGAAAGESVAETRAAIEAILAARDVEGLAALVGNRFGGG